MAQLHLAGLGIAITSRRWSSLHQIKQLESIFRSCLAFNLISFA